MARAAVLLALGLGLCAAPPAGSQSAPVLDARLRAALTSGYAADRLGLPARPDPDALVPCFIEGSVDDAALAGRGVLVGTRSGERLTARVPLGRLSEIAGLPGVRRIRAATRLLPVLDLSGPDVRAPLIRSGLPDTANGLVGENVLIGVIDTGIDWSHADFKTLSGSTRIAALWDQTDLVGPPPSGYAYGTAWTGSQIDLGGCREVDNTFFGHGTHVSGIAAGNGRATGNGKPAFTYIGVAPRAGLVAVKTTFYDTDIVDGANWIFGRAASLGRPAVVNLSLGSDHGPHDGTSDFELMLNSLSGPGRVIVAAGGNSNGKGTHGERIVPSVGEGVLSFRIFGYTPSPSLSEGVSLDGWYAGGDNLTVSVRSPSGVVTGPVAKGSVLTASTAEGYVSIDQTGIEALNANGDVEVAIEISDAAGLPVAAGDWEIRMTGVNVSHGGEIDCWIADHSFPGAPAFVNGRDETETVIEPGTADSLIAVAAHTTRSSWLSVNGLTYNYGQTLNQIATFSSIGPRRDAVLKPDLSAPGTAIGAAHSSTSNPNPTANILPDGVHKILQGTSMSTPHVAGAVALLLEKWPSLAAAQARGALTAAARSDGVTGVVPNATWGHGRLDVERLFRAILPFTQEVDPPRFGRPGDQVYLLDLCAVAGSASWPTRYRVRVSDSRGWLHYENDGGPVPIPFYSNLTSETRAGGRRCVPETGFLSIVIPANALENDQTLVTFQVEPEKLPLLRQTITTMVSVGTTAGVTDDLPPRLLLDLSEARDAAAPYVFRMALPRSGPVRLFLVDVQGRRRATLWDGRLEAGVREVNWAGEDQAGRRLEAGIYYARLDDGRETRSRPVVVLP